MQSQAQSEDILPLPIVKDHKFALVALGVSILSYQDISANVT